MRESSGLPSSKTKELWVPACAGTTAITTEAAMYLHWSKKIAIVLLAVFGVLMIVFWAVGGGEAGSVLKVHTTTWILLNYAGLIIWLFVWIGDQARMRGQAVWPWLIPL